MKKFLSLISVLLITFTMTACGSTKNPTAIIETSMGTIEAEIFQNEVPEMAKNFITLSEQGKYDGVPFHRVIKDFMVQTGDFTNRNGTGGYSYLGPDTEIPGQYDDKVSSNVRGTLSMANRGPDTNGSQFFINLADNTYLDHDKGNPSSQHPVFGKVTKGMDIVDAISVVDTDANDRPLNEVTITKITIQD